MIRKGHLGWQQDDGKFTLNQATAESFHIRENPWKIDVGKGQFDFDWLGYEVGESGVVMRYTLTEKRKGNTAKETERRFWTVEESIDVLSLLLRRLQFQISHPDQSNEVLTYWLRQTNFRSVSSNGQQAQRDQLEFLKPGQSGFTIDLSRRKSGQTMPRGYSISRISGPQLNRPYLFEPTGFSFANAGTMFVSTRAGGIWRYKNG